MSKYVIEFDKEQLLKYDKDTDTYFRTLYKAKGFNALVFDKNGLDKLTPLDKELEEAYQKGVHEGSLDVKERVEGAYQKGYEVGQHEATTLEYQQGLDDAWGFASHLAYVSDSVTNSIYISANGGKGLLVAFGMTYEEAKKQYDEYFDKKQKADEIKVGDEVEWGGEKIIVIQTFTPNLQKPQLHGIGSNGCVYYAILIEDVKKTGRHFPQVVELIKAMKEGAE